MVVGVWVKKSKSLCIRRAGQQRDSEAARSARGSWQHNGNEAQPAGRRGLTVPGHNTQSTGDTVTGGCAGQGEHAVPPLLGTGT